MKKLLAAATSIVMSASFITSAFASSITVSAAGGVSAVQPNVSMGGVLDEAVNKNATAADFIVTAPDITAKPGDKVKVAFTVNSGSHKGILLSTKVGTLPQDIKYSLADDDDMPVYDEVGSEYHAKVTDKDSNATSFNDDKPILVLDLDIPANAALGEYDYGLEFFHVVETAFKPVSEFDATIKKGKIKITSDASVTTQATATTTPNPTVTTTPGGNQNTDYPQQPSQAGKQSDFVLTGGEITLKPGESDYVEFIVQSGGHEAVLIQSKVDLSLAGTDKGLSYEIDTESPIECADEAYGEKFYSFLDTAGIEVSATMKDKKTSNAIPLIDGNSICSVLVTADANATPGKYLYGFKSYHVVENAFQPVKEFDAVVNYAKIEVVADGTDPVTTKAPTTTAKTTVTTTVGSGSNTDYPTPPSQDGKQKDFVLTGGEITLKPGESDYVEFTVQSGGHEAVLIQAKVDLSLAGTDKGLSYEIDTESPIECADEAYGEKFYSFLDTAGVEVSATMKDKKTSKAIPLIDGNSICSVLVTADANATPGKYLYGFKSYHVVENAFQPVKEFDAVVNYAKIVIVADGTDPVTTAAPIITTTTKPSTTATPDPATTVTPDPATTATPDPSTTATPDPATTAATVTTQTGTPAPVSGSAEWKIDTVKAPAGADVKVKVFVNGASDLKVAGASFGVKANTVKFTGTTEEQNVYKSKIFCNPTSVEFAFGHGEKGEGYTAGDQALIMALTYNVPAGTPVGTYDLEWANALICDSNGNDITDKVKLTNGAIEVIDDKQHSTDKVEWAIGNETVEVGDKEDVTVEVPVVVNDKSGAAIKVAGAQFGVSADTVKFTKATGSEAYGSDIFCNPAEGELAFGHGNKGAGVAAADGAKVAVLVFTVPAGTKSGTYPIKWSGSTFITDEDGNNLAENFTLTAGSITVRNGGTLPPVTGEVTWTIPEKHAKPGDTVEMDVIATIGENNPAIAGAQFKITAASPIEFSAATGSDAYGSGICNNAITNEFAFAQAAGMGVKADNNSVVLHLTYTVPKDIEAGTYPVEWSEAFICDTNGNTIDVVKLVNGAIIVDPVPTPTTTATTTDPDITTASATNSITTDNGEQTDVTTTAETSASTTSDGGQPAVTTTTAPVTAPEGGVIWQIDTKEAQPGDEVTLNVVVKDPLDSKLPIAGAQYIIEQAAPIELMDYSNKSTAYNASIIGNANTLEFAFLAEKLEGVASDDGEIVMTLTYKVPDNCPAGVYDVAFGKDFTFVSSADGIDITDKVNTVNGAIIIHGPPVPPVTTTTTPPPVTTDYVTTTPPPVTTSHVTTAPPPVTLHEGAIAWQIPIETAVPGDTVELEVLVNDPKNVKLPVGGAQFMIKYASGQESGIRLISATGSEAYATDFSGMNTTNGEFAFAHPKGLGVAAEDGGIVIKLTFEIPKDIKAGTYPVDFANLEVYDENGIDISTNVVAVNGAIIVLPPPTTTASAPAVTTASATNSITTDNGEQSDVTTTSVTTTDNGEQPDVTTTVSNTPIPDGKIGWILDNAKGKPGETVTLTMSVSNAAGVDLSISGGQFELGVTGPSVDSATGKPYGADLFYNTATKEFAFADAKGAGNASLNNATMMLVNFVIPEDATPGTIYVVTVDGIVAIDGNGADVSENVVGGTGYITVLPSPVTTTVSEPVTTTDNGGGDGTTTAPVTTTDNGGGDGTTTAPVTTSDNGGGDGTTTAPVTTTDNGGGDGTTTASVTTTDNGGSDVTTTAPNTTQAPGSGDGPGTTTRPYNIGYDVDATVVVVDGFYFSHDPRPFKSDHVKADEVVGTAEDGTKTLVEFDPSYLTFEEAVSKASTPAEAYNEDNKTFAYTVNVFYNGAPLMSDGKQVSFTAYIGVKGDTDFDNVVNAGDASTVLKYYAMVQTGNNDARLSPENCAAVNENPMLDELAAFLADVDHDVYSEDNWSTPKNQRELNAGDASSILKFYAYMQTGNIESFVAWNKVFDGANGADNREDLFNEYVKG